MISPGIRGSGALNENDDEVRIWTWTYEPPGICAIGFGKKVPRSAA
jgi:hypothetical protein